MFSRNHAVRNTAIGTVVGGLVMALPAAVPDYIRISWKWLNDSVAALLSLQSSDEPPISDLFVVFLIMFVLMGLTPLFDKFFAKIVKKLKTRGTLETLDRGRAKGGLEELFVEPDLELELYDFEVIILRSLALVGWKGLSQKHVAADLHLEPDFVEKKLMSLQTSGLVFSLDMAIFGKRFFLSGKGREYSKRQGFMASF